MMESQRNGSITYALMQKVLEKAWDLQDEHTIKAMSLAIDEATMKMMQEAALRCSEVV